MSLFSEQNPFICHFLYLFFPQLLNHLFPVTGDLQWLIPPILPSLLIPPVFLEIRPWLQCFPHWCPGYFPLWTFCHANSGSKIKFALLAFRLQRVDKDCHKNLAKLKNSSYLASSRCLLLHRGPIIHLFIFHFLISESSQIALPLDLSRPKPNFRTISIS